MPFEEEESKREKGKDLEETASLNQAVRPSDPIAGLGSE